MLHKPKPPHRFTPIFVALICAVTAYLSVVKVCRTWLLIETGRHWIVLGGTVKPPPLAVKKKG